MHVFYYNYFPDDFVFIFVLLFQYDSDARQWTYVMSLDRLKRVLSLLSPIFQSRLDRLCFTMVDLNKPVASDSLSVDSLLYDLRLDYLAAFQYVKIYK